MKASASRLVGGLYRLQEKIGEGTFGEIYKGTNERTKERVAIKIVCRFDSNCTQEQRRTGAKGLLLHEARIYNEMGGARNSLIEYG